MTDSGGIEKLMGYSNVYELHIYDFIEKLEPTSSFDLPAFDPQSYFITSGDAIQKTKYLCKVLWNYAGEARKQLHALKKPSAKDVKFEKSCWGQAGAARRMLHELEKTRGKDVFLETEWFEHRILCMPKNPRPKDTSVKNNA